jgi:heat shock protein HslJ
VYGSSGCNTYTGSYRVKGDTITVGDLAWTLMACLEPEGVMEQETLVMEHLSDAQTYRFVDGQLQIFQSDGEALTFASRE